MQGGLATLISGDGALDMGRGPVRTGVTAILPRGRRGLGESCAAGVHVLNGNGEMTGTVWINETGALNTPVLLTNSHAVGACHRGAIDWLNARCPELRDRWHMPVVAETYDGYLNDINGDHVTPAVARQALDAAAGGSFEEGSVGGGTGMSCYGFKGGTGTASRQIAHGGVTYTVAVLVQANFGARRELTLAGVPVGGHLRGDDPLGEAGAPMPAGAGSVVVTVATDAPLLPGQCAALARRVPLGRGRAPAAPISRATSSSPSRRPTPPPSPAATPPARARNASTPCSPLGRHRPSLRRHGAVRRGGRRGHAGRQLPHDRQGRASPARSTAPAGHRPAA
ncbi:P1 family peptidase [Streptomyces hypolithicus]